MSDELSEDQLFQMCFLTHPKTGRPYKLTPTEELRADYFNWLRAACAHEHIETMRIPLRNGSIQVRQQCVTCGTPVGTPIAHSKVENLSSLREGSTNDLYDYEKRRRSDLDEIKRRHFDAQSKPGWGTSEYKHYLQSDQWKAKRAAVLRRANSICEGCGMAEATVVHHHHYETIYDEWLWDLAALCRPCHAKCHPEHRAGDD